MSNKRTVTLTRTITFDVEVTLDWEHDDDGCGSPSSSGNSMTGNRGKYLTVTDYDIDMASVLAAVEHELDFECDEFNDVAMDAMNDIDDVAAAAQDGPEGDYEYGDDDRDFTHPQEPKND